MSALTISLKAGYVAFKGKVSSIKNGAWSAVANAAAAVFVPTSADSNRIHRELINMSNAESSLKSRAKAFGLNAAACLVAARDVVISVPEGVFGTVTHLVEGKASKAILSTPGGMLNSARAVTQFFFLFSFLFIGLLDKKVYHNLDPSERTDYEKELEGHLAKVQEANGKLQKRNLDLLGNNLTLINHTDILENLTGVWNPGYEQPKWKDELPDEYTRLLSRVRDLEDLLLHERSQRFDTLIASCLRSVNSYCLNMQHIYRELERLRDTDINVYFPDISWDDGVGLEYVALSDAILKSKKLPNGEIVFQVFDALGTLLNNLNTVADSLRNFDGERDDWKAVENAMSAALREASGVSSQMQIDLKTLKELETVLKVESGIAHYKRELGGMISREIDGVSHRLDTVSQDVQALQLSSRDQAGALTRMGESQVGLERKVDMLKRDHIDNIHQDVQDIRIILGDSFKNKEGNVVPVSERLSSHLRDIQNLQDKVGGTSVEHQMTRHYNNTVLPVVETKADKNTVTALSDRVNTIPGMVDDKINNFKINVVDAGLREKADKNTVEVLSNHVQNMLPPKDGDDV